MPADPFLLTVTSDDADLGVSLVRQDEVRSAMSVLADPAYAVQIQALPSAAWGTFAGDDLHGIARAAAEIAPGNRGVYWTLNPCPRDLASPMATRFAVRRRWLMLDFDPRRPKDTNATEQEHEAARLVAYQVQRGLSESGWPAPIMVDSGNGWQLLYRIDLENNKGVQALLRNVINVLADLYSTEAAEIDRKVHDGRRLAKLPGTLVRKGPATPDRPHRWARLVFVPEPVEIVTAEQMEALADTLRVKADGTSSESRPLGNGTSTDVPPSPSVFKTSAGADHRRAYARGALQRCVADVVLAPPATGNDALNKAAFGMGRLVGAGAILRQEAEHALHMAAVHNGRRGEDETKTTIRSGLDAGIAQPRDLAFLDTTGGSAAAGLATTGLDTIDPEPLRWLVPEIIPLGKLTLFAGDGGHGKSTLTLALAAAVTTGRPAFGQVYAAPPPGDVLIVSCEDDFGDTVVPRLLAAGADLGRVRRIDGVRTPGGKVSPFSLAHFEAVEDELTKRPSVRLIIIDPAGAYVGGADDHRDSELRGLLGPLAEVAARRDVSVILVKHLSKNTSTRAVNRVMGSAGYVNAVRAAFLIAPDDKDDRRLFVRLKANLSPVKVGFAFRHVQVPHDEAAALLARFESLTTEDRDRLAGQLFRLEFLGHVDAEADDVLAAHDRKQRGPSRVEECAAWLEEFLGDGPRVSADIDAEAAHQGFTKDNVNKAKAELKAKGLRNSNRGGFGGRWASGFGDPASWVIKFPGHSHEPPPNTQETHENRENHDNAGAGEPAASHSHEPLPITPETHDIHENHDNGASDALRLDRLKAARPTHTDDSRDCRESLECPEMPRDNVPDSGAVPPKAPDDDTEVF
jgi:hypothetical protein